MIVELKAHSWATQQQSIDSCDLELSQSPDTDGGGSKRLVS